ncbi:MAG: hypothetical protein AAFU79_20240 [Myxococcota bacterium]
MLSTRALKALFWRRLLPAATLLCGMGGTAPAWAQAYEPPRLLGFAGAQRALGTGNDALYQNPAGLAFSGSYEVEIGYADDFREADRRVTLSIADGQAGEFAGGLGLTYARFRPAGETEGDRRLDGLRFDVGLAAMLGRTLAVGVTTRFGDYRLLAGDDEVPDGGTSALTFDVGLQWQLGQGFSVGGLVRNLTSESQPGMPRAWGAGLGYRSGPLLAEVDVDHAWETVAPVYSGTVGFIIAEQFPLRVGTSFDSETERFSISGGAGFVVDRIAVDLAYRQRIDPVASGEDADERLFAVSFRVRAF